MDYCVITSTSPTGLSALVNIKIDLGYKCQGGVSYSKSKGIFMQSMLKND